MAHGRRIPAFECWHTYYATVRGVVLGAFDDGVFPPVNAGVTHRVARLCQAPHSQALRPVAGFVHGRRDHGRMRHMQNTVMSDFCDAQQRWTEHMGALGAHPIYDRVRRSIRPVWEAAMRQANDLVLNNRLPR